ncbi:MAG TPA: hypothetical protein PLW32_03045 [Chitinophagaceae bacterium]|jgi:type VI secretion system secreted protein VgrG|nr:hypothetical protein [Chitinophagaceae bacterium]MBP9739675.1 hypothetical protein [Chitinophagaceae bacterium]HPH22836.1 hypothetical protein [Chitinophagaceae bacterium]
MKKLLLLSTFCILLIVVVYSRVQLAIEKKLTFEAQDEIVIKTGYSSITMKKNGSIIIKGSDIQIIGTDEINVKASGKVILKGNKIASN